MNICPVVAGGACPLWIISGHQARNCDVCFTPESGHGSVVLQCPLLTQSGHWPTSQVAAAKQVSASIALGLSLVSFSFFFLREPNVVMPPEDFNMLRPEACAFESQRFYQPSQSGRRLAYRDVRIRGHAGSPVSRSMSSAASKDTTDIPALVRNINSRFPMCASVRTSFRGRGKN